jgi:hypothetical protein
MGGAYNYMVRTKLLLVMLSSNLALLDVCYVRSSILASDFWSNQSLAKADIGYW